MLSKGLISRAAEADIPPEVILMSARYDFTLKKAKKAAFELQYRSRKCAEVKDSS